MFRAAEALGIDQKSQVARARERMWHPFAVRVGLRGDGRAPW